MPNLQRRRTDETSVVQIQESRQRAGILNLRAHVFLAIKRFLDALERFFGAKLANHALIVGLGKGVWLGYIARL